MLSFQLQFRYASPKLSRSTSNGSRPNSNTRLLQIIIALRRILETIAIAKEPSSHDIPKPNRIQAPGRPGDDTEQLREMGRDWVLKEPLMHSKYSQKFSVSNVFSSA
jgi:hypothetical protein